MTNTEEHDGTETQQNAEGRVSCEPAPVLVQRNPDGTHDLTAVCLADWCPTCHPETAAPDQRAIALEAQQRPWTPQEEAIYAMGYEAGRVQAAGELWECGCIRGYIHSGTEQSCAVCGKPKPGRVSSWEPTGLWRAVDPDGEVLCESGSESEVRQRRRDTDTIQRHMRRVEEEWRDA